MQRARIKPRFSKSQYSQTANMLDGYELVVEGGKTFRFTTRKAAEQYAASQGYKLVYSGKQPNNGKENEYDKAGRG